MYIPRLFFVTLAAVLLGAFWVNSAVSSTTPTAQTAPQTPDDMTLVQLTNIPHAQAGYFMDAHISGNGRKVVYGDAGMNAYRTLYLVDVDGDGTPQVIDRKEDMHLESLKVLDISYDGNRVLYFRKPAQGAYQQYIYEAYGLYVYDAQTETRTKVLPCYTDERISQPKCLIPGRDDSMLSGDGRHVFFFSSGEWQCVPRYDAEAYPPRWVWQCSKSYEHGLFKISTDDLANPEAVTVMADIGGAISEGGYFNGIHYPSVDYGGRRVAFELLVRDNSGDTTLPESGVYLVEGPGRWRQFRSVTAGGTILNNYLSLSADGQWLAHVEMGDPEYYNIEHVSGASRYRHAIPSPPGDAHIDGISQDGQRLLLEAFSHLIGDSAYELWFADQAGNLTPVDPDGNRWLWYGKMAYDGQSVAFSMNVDDGSEQYFVLQGQATPDLSVDDFVLDPDTIVREDGRYVLSVAVTVHNVGRAGAANVPVRFQGNDGWSHTETVATLDADGSTVLNVEWDITALLEAGAGRAQAQLTVTADPDEGIAETSNLNNAVSRSMIIDARPRVRSVEPQFKLDGAYFLANQSVANRVRVRVDWNGDLGGSGEAPYGDVVWDLNGTQFREAGQPWGAAHTFDMGRDFQSSFSCANNTLHIWAEGDFESLKTTLQPTVFPFPGWVDWLEDLELGAFSTEEKAPLVAYTYGFSYPEEPFEATWQPPAWIPYLGGREIGIQETQASAEATGQSDGVGEAGVSGKTGLDLSALTAEGELWGQGEAQFACGKSLDLQRAELGFRIQATVEKEAGLVDVIPAVKAAEKWPVVGRIIRWVNSVATIKGAFTPAVEIVTEFETQGDRLQFDHSEGTGSIEAKAELATEVCEDLSASVYGGGTPYVTIQVPQDSGYLKEVGIELFYGATFQAWAFEEEYERKVNCHYPGECSEIDEEAAQRARAAGDGPTWRLIPRDYAGANYALADQSAGQALRVSGTTTESILVNNVYPRPEPALTVRGDDQRLLAYVHDDTAKPHGRGTEVRVLVGDGSGWESPTALTDDVQPDFAPTVAFDGDDHGLVVWELATLPESVSPTLDLTFAQSLEIAYAVYTPTLSTWSMPLTLTTNSLMDHAPRLAAGTDGTVMALWQTQDGTDVLGTAEHPLTYTYAVWDGAGWHAPSVALGGLQDVLGTAFAVYSATEATLVYVVDADGVLTTTADTDLYYSRFDGTGWDTPAVMADGEALADAAPALAYDAAGRLHLLWLRGDPLDGAGRDLVWLRDSWDLGQAQVVRSGSDEGGFLGFRLSRAPGGHLALIWQAMGEGGADLAYSIHDAAAGTAANVVAWGIDQPLTRDGAVEAAHSSAFGDDGMLYLAYQKVGTKFVTRTVTVSSTSSYTVTNLPTAGQSDLAFLAHSVGVDLALDNLTLTPTNPTAGQAVTLTAVLRNAGDLVVEAPQVAFYDGADPIVTQTLDDLGGGYTMTVQVGWTVPAPAAMHVLQAVADPQDQVGETDETNNALTLTTTLPNLQVDVLYTLHSAHALTATVRLINDGALAAAAPFAVALRVDDPVTGTLLSTLPVTANLAVGERMTVTWAMTEPATLAGVGETLWARVDSGDGVTEANEDDNLAYATLGVLPDLSLAATDIGGSGPITITVHNRGAVTATGTALAAWRGGLSGTLVYSSALHDLGPGATQTLTLNLAPGPVELWAKADPENMLVECDESNNLAVRDVFVASRVYLPLALR